MKPWFTLKSLGMRQSFINPAFLTRFGCLWSSTHAIIESQSNCGQTSQTSVRLIFVSWNKYNCSSWPWQYYYKELLLELRLGVVRVCWCRSTACERKQGVWPSWAPSRLPLVLAVTVKVCNLCNPPYIPTYSFLRSRMKFGQIVWSSLVLRAFATQNLLTPRPILKDWITLETG